MSDPSSSLSRRSLATDQDSAVLQGLSASTVVALTDRLFFRAGVPLHIVLQLATIDESLAIDEDEFEVWLDELDGGGLMQVWPGHRPQHALGHHGRPTLRTA